MIIGIDIRLIGKKRTGDEVVFFNLTKELAKLDSKNTYKLFTDIADNEIIKKIKNDLGIDGKNNFEIISLKSQNRFTWNFWDLMRYLRKNPVDIYLTQYITPFFVPKKIKIITIIHDISFIFFPQFIKLSDLFFLKTLIPLSLRRANKIIAVSRFTADEILGHYKVDSQKVDFVHNAVSEDFILKSEKITPEDIEKVRKKYNLPEKFILYIGTFQPRKNIPALIEALALMNNLVKLVLAGKKSRNYDFAIDKAIEKNNLKENVIFPGYIAEEDKATVMKAAEIFVFPSLYEGFGIPILEAMAAEIPVVASDIAPHKEIAFEAAMFFNPQIPGELEQKIQELLKSETLRNNLIIKGKEQAQKFSWKNSAEKLLGIIDKDTA